MDFILSSHEQSTPIFQTIFSSDKKGNKTCHSSVHQFTKFTVFKNQVPKKIFEFKTDNEEGTAG
jgi:hypothetical protein